MVTNGQEIKKRRIKMGITLERMSDVLNLLYKETVEYEKGTPITFEKAEELSWFLHCEVSDIAHEGP
ncbi:hypothetical protein CUN38_04880 [Enterococcus faecium]|uniref:hypothetical protein n=1 Tax=Enterococcus faecium TaxID=1352 RepID=UPI000CF195E8|nr:hypothetical protein [Enterococcus faecium]PQC93478.1 hypothetical protein CUN38_04880 [Enterococcus faecium]